MAVVPTRGRGLSISLIILCLAFQAIIHGAISLFLPLIREDLSLSFTQAGSLIAASTLAYALMQIPAGYLGDRFGPKRLFFTGILGTTTLLVAFGLVSQYWQALTNEWVSGFFRALLFAPGMALITAWFPPERRATAMAFHLTGIFGGAIILNIVGPLLVEISDWRFPFFTFGAIGIFASLAYLLFSREAPGTRSEQKVYISDVVNLLRSRIMWLCGGIQYARLAVFAGVSSWLPTLLIDNWGLSLKVTGLIIALRSALIGPSSIAGGYISDRLKNPPLVIGFSFIILATTTALLVSVNNIALVIVLIVINSLFANCYFGPVFALPLEILDSPAKSTTTGAGNFFATIGGFTFTYLLGALRDSSGSFESGFYAMAGACVVGLVFTLLVARVRRKVIAPKS